MKTQEANNAVEPEYTIELRISFQDPETGVSVPLGFYGVHGEWLPYDLDTCQAHNAMSPEDMVNWIEELKIKGSPLLLDYMDAKKLVRDTRERCATMAEAARKHSEAREPIG